MKKIIYTLCFISFLLSCRSIEKLVDQGKYDEAIVLATKKISGKKKKKTSHIQNIEKAFAKITKIDMDRINSLDALNNSYNWERVLAISDKITKRQNRIQAFLPLVSKDGYKAKFQFVNTSLIRDKALNGSAEYQYQLAKNLLNKAKKNNDKLLAQKAFYHFKNVSDFRKYYKDCDSLKALCRTLGTVQILIDFKEEGISRFEEKILLEEINTISALELNDFWTNYHLFKDSLTTYDQIANIQLSDHDISPERETITNHTDSKKIKDGWVYDKKRNGEIKTDSLGKKIKLYVFRNVKADVSEMSREKSAFISATLTTVDAKTLQVLEIKPLSVETHFSDYSIMFRGDRRALCNHDINRLKDKPIAFPNDIEILMDAAYNLKKDLIYELKGMHI